MTRLLFNQPRANLTAICIAVVGLSAWGATFVACAMWAMGVLP